MATKKKVTGIRPKNTWHEGKTMTKEEIKMAKEFLDEVGTGKAEGYIMIAKIKDKGSDKDHAHFNVQGVTYIGDAAPLTVAATVIRNSGFSSMVYLEAIKEKVLSGMDHRNHNHD